MLRAVIFCAILVSPQLVFAQEITSVPMSDGVELHTRVYKRSDTPRPVILIRTPYGAAAAAEARVFNLLRSDAEEFQDAGYVYVTQDLRGTGQSQGGDTLRFVEDQADTEATLEWISQQPWSNGRVAMWGVSAPGIVAQLALQNPHPSLSCVATVIAAGDVHQMFYPGGAYRQELGAGWLPDNAGTTIEHRVLAAEERTAFWDDGIITDAELPTRSVKTLTFAGTFDIFALGGIGLHEQLVRHAAPAEDHILFVGPWAHNSVVPSRGADLAGALSGDLKFELQAFVGPGLAIDPRSQFFSFLGWCLKDLGRPNARVRAYRFHIEDQPDLAGVRARGSWVNYPSWPPPQAQAQAMYLRSEPAGGALTNAPGGQAFSVPAETTGVATRGGALLFSDQAANYRPGPRNEVQLLNEIGVAVFETNTATSAVDIVGNARAVIWGSSATTDIDAHVKVYLRTAMGEYFLLTDGARRGRYVQGLDTRLPLTPGQAYQFDVDLGPVSFRLRPGQSIAVAIQTSNVPRFDLNSNTAAPLIDRPAAVASTLTVQTSATQASYVELPVTNGQLPLRSFSDTDAGVTNDTGGSDAEPSSDAAPGLDAAPRLDAGAPADASGNRDAGTDTESPQPNEGCSCSATGPATRRSTFGGVLLMFVAFCCRRWSRMRSEC